LVWPLFAHGIPATVFLSLGCALSWAFATVYMKWMKTTVEPLANAAWQLLFGFLFIAAGTFMFDGYPRLWPMQTNTLLAVLYIGVFGVGLAMLLGIGLVALSMVVMLRVTSGADPLAREDLAFALSVVLLGLLMMVTRRNAVSQVVGFMSLENGLVLAATGAKGMPLVVEISVAFSVLIAFIVIGIFLFRIRERFDSLDTRHLEKLKEH
jgi:hypothetical protein